MTETMNREADIARRTGRRAKPTHLDVRTSEPEPIVGRQTGVRAAIRRWRCSRPFWGCLVLALGGYWVMSPMLGASLQMIVGAGIRAAYPLVIGGGMILAALLALFIPSNRHFLGIAGMVLSIMSLPFANLGGWLVGMVLGIIGSGLVFAWAPYTDDQLAEFAGRARRKAERKARRRTHGAES